MRPTSHNRTPNHSINTHLINKLQNEFHNWKGMNTEDLSDRPNTSKTTVLLQDKKTNGSNIINFSETTINSQFSRDSMYREGDSKNRSKLTDRGMNSKEITIISTHSNHQSQTKADLVPTEAQVKELKAIYDLKEREVRMLQESREVIKEKIARASNYIGKNTNLTGLIQERDKTIENLKINLEHVVKELEDLRFYKESRSNSNICGIVTNENKSSRESKKILIRMDTSRLKPRVKKHYELKFKMYMDGLNDKGMDSSLRIKAPLTQRVRHPGHKGNLSERSYPSFHNDSDNYLLNENFRSKIKGVNQTSRDESKPTCLTNRDTPNRSISKRLLSNESEPDSKILHFDHHENGNENTCSKSLRPLKKIENSHIGRDEYSTSSDVRNKRGKPQIMHGFNALLTKFATLLEKYEKSEDLIIKRNKELHTKLVKLTQKNLKNN